MKKIIAIACFALFMPIANAIDMLPLGNPQVDGDTCIQANDGGTIKNSLCVDGATGDTEILAGQKLKVDKLETNAGGPPPGTVPIGGMVAVMPTTHANAWQPPTSCTTDDDGVSDGLKDGFVLAGWSSGACVVPASCGDCVIPATTSLPNMFERSTRGSTTSGGTGGSTTDTIDLIPSNIPELHNSTLAVSGSTSIDHDHGAVNSGNPTTNFIDHTTAVQSGGEPLNIVPSGSGSFAAAADHLHSVNLPNYNVSNRTLTGGVTQTLVVGTAANTTFDVDTITPFTDVVWVIRVK